MSDGSTALPWREMATPWTVDVDAGIEHITDANGNWVAECNHGKAHLIAQMANSCAENAYLPSPPTTSPTPGNELLEAAKEFADAAANEFNEKGAGGFALARLTDLRTAISNAESST